MKNYIMIILLTLVTTIMINTGGNVKADILTEVSETSEISTLETLSSIDEAESAKIASTPVIAKNTVKTVGYSTSSYNFAISKNIAVSQIDENKNPSNNIISAGNLVYAHNSSNLLGVIRNFSVGATFTLTENGEKTTYKVVKTAIFKKTGEKTLGLCTNGYDNCDDSVYYMSNFANNSKFMGVNYDKALFTCDGTSLGDGDATHRKVVFAVRV